MIFQHITTSDITHFSLTTSEHHVFFLDCVSGEFVFDITSPGAKLSVFGLYDCSGSEKHILKTTQLHTAPNTESELFVKSIVRDSSQFFFDGLIRIEHAAQKTDASLTNKNLLLSPDAFIDAKPYLEILPDDVRCSHAVTTSALNPEQLFYLQSRGVSQKNAEALLSDGFSHDVFLMLSAYGVDCSSIQKV